MTGLSDRTLRFPEVGVAISAPTPGLERENPPNAEKYNDDSYNEHPRFHVCYSSTKIMETWPSEIPRSGGLEDRMVGACRVVEQWSRRRCRQEVRRCGRPLRGAMLEYSTSELPSCSSGRDATQWTSPLELVGH
jgi:hypothetical protein